MAPVTRRQVVAGVRRRLGSFSQRLRDVTPRRLPNWDEQSATATGGRPGDLTVGTVGELTRHLLRTADTASVRELRVVVERWQAPRPGWSGRLGPLPGLLTHQVALPAAGTGRAQVAVTLTDALPLHRVVAAVLAVLRPDPALPAPGSVDIAVDGPLPGWLDPAAVTHAPAGPEPGDAPVRPYDLRLSPADAEPPAEPPTGRLNVPAARLAGDTTGVRPPADPPVVLVDAGAANPVGRNRYGAKMPVGRLVLTDDRWRIDTGSESHTVVAGRIGEPLDGRQSAVLRDLYAVTVPPQAGAGPALAATVAQLAMTGLLVHAPDLPAEVTGLLGPELAALTTLAPPGPDTDAVDRELASVRQRRAALRRHAAAVALPRAIADHPGLATPPSVTALLMTRRPERLVVALRDLAGQTYPQLEVVVGLHGVELPPQVAAAVAACPLPVQVVTVGAGVQFGAALAEVTRHARGTLVTKVDDDDRYGVEHVWDLVLARHYSAATVVGKGAEFVYLEPRDLTVRRRMASEIYDDVVAGGTMLLSRGDLEAVGGWRPVNRSIDRALLDRVLDAGGLVYRTHGFGFLYTRHGEGHTWDPGLDYFVQNPLRQWTGLPPHESFGTA
ncbi:hypothetical protein [Micromonospora siamensis]|uniref:Glycosyltransferase involved in cell wall bisynthesis n=1 Tax=Micromonospora siamensis TaxID=299152 RepID=A0A1C5HH30_9ACTN|nr:hypothetical protein [Micromonospora siamensis]SCG45177.1 Glycosyltransferase involved in cell wall bisynthesis [Micromonospora siamensis]